jgi:hypothetical protein
MTDSQSASLSWCQAASGAQDHILLRSVAGLFMWGVLPDERTGLSFIIAPLTVPAYNISARTA